MSNLFKLNTQDFIKGLALAVITAVLSLLVEILKQKGFDLTIADWQQILQQVIIVVLAYLSKNLATDSDNKILGRF